MHFITKPESCSINFRNLNRIQGCGPLDFIETKSDPVSEHIILNRSESFPHHTPTYTYTYNFPHSLYVVRKIFVGWSKENLESFFFFLLYVFCSTQAWIYIGQQTENGIIIKRNPFENGVIYKCKRSCCYAVCGFPCIWNMNIRSVAVL